jgi:hypothetical protein
MIVHILHVDICINVCISIHIHVLYMYISTYKYRYKGIPKAPHDSPYLALVKQPKGPFRPLAFGSMFDIGTLLIHDDDVYF